MKILWTLSAAAAIGVTVLACSSTSSNTSGYSATSCPGQGASTEACTACLTNNCTVEVANVNSSCTTADFTCSCRPTAPMSGCTLTSGCNTAGAALGQCTVTKCSPSCGTGGGSTGTDAGTDAG